MLTAALVELIMIFIFLYPTAALITYFNVTLFHTDLNYVKNLPLFY